jgi:ubiquinone/menaquinone biosynthesis C-methylase UbiE
MMKRGASLAFVMLIACGGSPPPEEGPMDHAAGHPGHHHGHHDGHHGQGHHHGFSDVERFARIFDDPERDAWQMPEQVLELLAIQPGMTVVDLGAGTGYFLPHLARAVGPEGRVIALDVEPNMVAHMQQRIAEAGWTNVEAQVAATDDPSLDPGSVDRILIVDTWHHIEGRERYTARLREALREGGTVTIVDFTRDSPQGPPPAMRLSAEAVVEELRAGGLAPAIREERLPYQWVVTAQAAR